MRRGLGVTAAALVVAVVLGAGVVLTRTPWPVPQPAAPSAARPHGAEIDTRFKQGVVMLHAKQFEYAVAAFHQVLKYAPDMPEAHVNMGFALAGLGHHAQARDFFESATALRPRQANAYYGLALAFDGLGDRPAAIGAMRTYLHLTHPADPYRRKAESALWEWESAARR